MGRSRKDGDDERISFDVTGELAEFMRQLKERGIHQDNADITRAGLVQLRYYYQQIGLIKSGDEAAGSDG